MAKSASNKLFLLIKSMNRGEIKFFRNFAARTDQEESKYQMLFELMLRSNENNEADFFNQLYPDGTVTNKFQVLKYDLFNLTLRSLRIYHEERNLFSKIRSTLQNVDILTLKGLYDEAEEFLNKAIALADKYDLDLFKLEFHYWEFKIAFLSLDVKRLEKVGNIETDVITNEVYRFDQSLLVFRNFAHIIAKTRTIGMLRDPETISNLSARIQESYVELQEDSMMIKHLKMYMKGMYSFLINDREAMYQNQKKLVTKMQADRKSIDRPGELLFCMAPAIGDLATSCALLEYYDEMNYYLKEMEACLSFLPKSLHFRLHKRVYFLKIINCCLTGVFSEGLILIKQAGQMAKKYEGSFPFNLEYFRAYCCFGLERFEEALDLLNKIASLNVKQGKDVQALARILRVICVYELKDNYRSDYLESLILSTYRFLKKRKRLYGVEKLFLKFVKKLILKKPDVSIQTLFAQMSEEVSKTIEKNEQEKYIRNYFDFPCWLQAKATGRSFGDVIQEKVNSRLNKKNNIN